jgi:hypothetical protein
VSEMVEAAEKSHEDDHTEHDDDDDDDGWDELGLGGTAKMDKDELARAKNVQHSFIIFNELF